MDDRLYIKSKLENGGLSVQDNEEETIDIEYCAYWPIWSDFWETDRGAGDAERIIIIITELGGSDEHFNNVNFGMREHLLQVDLIVCENTDKYDPHVIKGSLKTQIEDILKANLAPADRKSLHFSRNGDLDKLDEGVLRYAWSIIVKN